MDNFFLDADFDKGKVKDLVDDVRAFLLKSGNVQTALWAVEPFSFSLHLNQVPNSTDLTVLMDQIYARDEVYRVSLAVEPASKWILMHVGLNERWFCEGKKHEKPRRRRHPEDELEA